VLAKTGLRPGEGMALKPGDLDFRSLSVRVELRRSREVDHLRSAEVTQGRNSGGKVDQERDRERNEVMDRDARDVDHS
jgi:integrase